MRFLLLILVTFRLVALEAMPLSDCYHESLRLERLGDAAGAARVLVPAQGHYLATLRSGWLALAAGRWDEALTAYTAAQRLAPGSLEPRLGRLRTLVAAQRWVVAEVQAREVLVADPGNAIATCLLAAIQAGTQRWEEAQTTITGHLLRWPSDTGALGQHAAYAFQLRRYDLAEMTWRNLALLDPGNAEASAGLAALAAIQR